MMCFVLFPVFIFETGYPASSTTVVYPFMVSFFTVYILDSVEFMSRSRVFSSILLLFGYGFKLVIKVNYGFAVLCFMFYCLDLRGHFDKYVKERVLM